MNQESNRLQTFEQWSSEAIIDPHTIAKSGFYYTGQGQEVQCFRCGGKISEWNLGDDVMVRHRQLDPRCPFVVNPISSGNIPISNIPLVARAEGETVDAPENTHSYIDDVDMNLDEIYKNDAMRLLSFVNWPLSYISRESLAVAGFYYMGGKPGVAIDKVRCAWCAGELENWVNGDKPISEHTRHFPNCGYAREKAEALNKSEQSSQPFNNENLLHSNMVELGIQSHSGVARSNYCSLETRMQSFENWPENNPQQPKDLAAAGYYFTGNSDEVRCFYCDGGLCNWTPDDDPWIEHAKYHPQCNFLNIAKGREFVDHYRKDAARPGATLRPESGWAVTDENVEYYMNSEFVLAALQCGLQPERLRRAIRVRLEKTRTPFLSTEALIDAALNEQLNETPFSTGGEVPSNPSAPTGEDAGPSSSGSSRQLRVNDAAIDHVTRMIIDSALSGRETLANTSNSNVPIDKASSPARSLDKSLSKSNSTKSVSSAVSLEEENRLLKEARTCKVCMDSEVGIVFLPCGHLVTCVECAICLAQCPLCRSSIKGVVKTYLS